MRSMTQEMCIGAKMVNAGSLQILPTYQEAKGPPALWEPAAP